MEPRVRVTGFLIERDEILLVEQDVTESRHWSHPGGAVELGETMEQCLIREVREETGLDVSIGDLLYVCDRIQTDSHVVHISFLVSRTGGKLGTGDGAEFAAGKIKSVKMVPVRDLSKYGFSATYCNLVKSGFPDRGTYKGNIANIGL